MYSEVLGVTNPDAPTLVFSSGLGGSAHFWQPQLSALLSKYRIILYDQNGTGRSPAVLPEGYSTKTMATELLVLLDELQVTSCHLIGHALGGLVGLELALLRPKLLQSLVLVNAWSSPNPHTLRCFNIRKSLLHNNLHEAYLQAQALLLYPPDWIMNNAEELAQEERKALENFPDKANLLTRIKALSEFDMDSQLGKIDVNTLAIVNKDDMLVPWQRSIILVDGLPKAILRILEYGGHASSITDTDMFNECLLSHLMHYD